MMRTLSTRSGRPEQYDAEAFEISNARLRLRSDWSFTMRTSNRQPTYVLFHSQRAVHYEIGWSQYAFLSMLDGRKTLAECVREMSQLAGQAALAIDQAIQTANWALKLGLVEAVDSDGQTIVASTQAAAVSDSSIEKMLGQANPLLVKMRVGDPSDWVLAWPLLGRSLAMLGHCLTSRLFAAVWLGLFAFACARLSVEVRSLWQASQEILDIHNGLYLVLTGLCLKIIHELAHASVCMALGGKVQETGVMFILLMPVPYVDVSSSWQFNSRWARMQVAAAGMAIELFVAAIAAIWWSSTQEPWQRYHLFNVMVAASVTTLLFNANFLMRFDGYFLLSDALGVVNLYSRGQQAVARQARRWLFGFQQLDLGERSERRPSIGSFLIGVYGLAALSWRCLVTITMTIAAARMFQGAGILFAAISVVIWFSPSLRSLFGRLSGSDPVARSSRRHFSLITAPILALLVLLAFLCPWPFRVHAPAIVRYRDSEDVRAQTAGFVREIAVVDGQAVAAGDLLLRLENRELSSERQRVEMQFETAQLRSRQLLARGEIASWQAERGVCEALESQLNDLDHRLSQLELRAPIAGKVAKPHLDSLRDCYLPKGQVILQIINEDSKELVASIDQPDVEFFSAAYGAPVVLSLRGLPGQLTGSLKTVTPKASLKCDSRLTSLAGGPLAIRRLSETSAEPHESSSSIEASLGPESELLRARFEAVIALPEDQANQLMSGMTGNVELPSYGHSIASHIVQRCREFLAR